MQTFYDELTNSSIECKSRLKWLESVRQASQKQIMVLQETALAWVSWESE